MVVVVVVKEEEGSVADDESVQIGDLNPCVGAEADWWFRKGLLKTSSTCPLRSGDDAF